MGSRALALPAPWAEAPASLPYTLYPGKSGLWSRWLFGTPNLPTQLASQNHLRGPFQLLPSTSLRQRVSPWRGGRRKETGRGPCHHPEFLKPWHKGLGSRPPSGEEGEEWLPGHRVTFRGPQRRAPGPSLPRTSPLVPPGLGGGLKFLFPFIVGVQEESSA